MIVENADLAATDAVAAKLAKVLVEHGPSSVVIGLVGPMGAGKTTFVQGFVRALAPDRDIYVTSPTFAIAQIYDTNPEVRHLDLFRLEHPEELEAIGFRELYYEPGFALVEWIDRIPELTPKDWIEVELRVREDDRRVLHLTWHGGLHGSLGHF